MTRTSRWITRLLLLTCALLLLAVVGFHLAVRKLKTEVEAALGPTSTVDRIAVGWHSVTLSGLRIRAPDGWPVADTLHAASVTIRPDLRGLFQGDIHIAAIDVDGAFLSVWRNHNGKVRLLPNLLEGKPAPSGGHPEADGHATGIPRVRIDHIAFDHSELAFVDDSVARRVSVDLTDLNITIHSLAFPTGGTATQFDLSGKVAGQRHSGTVSLNGMATLANYDSQVKLKLQSVDLVPLAPYLLKASDTGVKQGTLDLQIDSTVKHDHLHAPGHIDLHDLSLDSRGSFLGASRSAAVDLLKSRQGTISAQFVLEGNLNDPRFSLNENLLERAGAGLANALGVSVEGLTRNIGSAAEGVGARLKGLFH